MTTAPTLCPACGRRPLTRGPLCGYCGARLHAPPEAAAAVPPQATATAPPPAPPAAESEEITVCVRKPFRSTLFSPWGLMMLLLAPLTLGVTLLVLVGMHFGAMPRRVWLKGGRLHADKALPAAGVPAEDIRLELCQQRLYGADANRWLRLHFTDERGKERFLNLNQVYFGPEALDRVVLLVSMFTHAAARAGR